ncbi:MAG: SDR family NAD(P)-dependent oxidoreductase [Saprospiraceae bacterium]|nr:SDR family NAD(P)-dependent oxidoreductase [Saprospiraceae bacterium]MCB9320885.1 SDR family NAD(P)-dependent oxidoreductase [Lewinellaceae bacterium]
MKKILVTGANGFLGAHLVRFLSRQPDIQVLAMHREHSDLSLVKDLLDSPGIRWITGDVLVLSALRDAIRTADVVIHNAAVVSYRRREAAQMIAVNVEGTANIVNLMLEEENPGRLIYISSVAATGHVEQGLIDENAEWRDEVYHSNYSWSKYWAELEVWRGFAEGLSGLIFNPSTVLGTGNWDQSSCQLFGQVWRGLQFYAPGGTGFVDVRDVVAAVWEGIKRDDLTEERYILNGTNTSYRDLLTRIAGLLGKPVPRWEVTRLLRRMGLMVIAPLEAVGWWPHPISTEILRNTGQTNRFDAQKAIRELSIQFTPLEETLEFTCTQFLAEHTR